MSRPKRIRLSRAKGARKPEGAIVVARPTRWGNPFIIGDSATLNTPREIATITITPAVAVACYRDLMDVRLLRDPKDHPDDAAWVQRWHDGLAALAGHDLACWCPLDQPCHADVLLDLANPRNRSTITIAPAGLAAGGYLPGAGPPDFGMGGASSVAVDRIRSVDRLMLAAQQGMRRR